MKGTIDSVLVAVYIFHQKSAVYTTLRFTMFILTAEQKLGKEVCNYTVSLLHTLVFFWPLSGRYSANKNTTLANCAIVMQL